MNGATMGLTASLCTQIAINKMQLCSLSIAYACPYHNHTATTGNSVHNVDNVSKPLAHTTPYTDVEVLGWRGYTWSVVVRPVGLTVKIL